MLLCNAEFFDRSLNYYGHDYFETNGLDDDYLSPSTNTVTIAKNDGIKIGYYIRITGDFEFFGVITDIVPNDDNVTMNVSFKSFITVFDEQNLFNCTYQGTTASTTRKSLEYIIYEHLAVWHAWNSDTLQNMPISMTILSGDPATVNSNQTLRNSLTTQWTLNIANYNDDSYKYAVINLLNDMIIPALKTYGIAITVSPDFTNRVIRLDISKVSNTFHIDADLSNVKVKALKYNERPNGVNKFIVYDSRRAIEATYFYVYEDHTWGIDETREDRITPVVIECEIVDPPSEVQNGDETITLTTEEGFALAALDAAYNKLEGLKWENAIELEVTVNDQLVHPNNLKIGQPVAIHYKDAIYTSILTGKTYQSNTVTLLFGSERIEYSKRRSSK